MRLFKVIKMKKIYKDIEEENKEDLKQKKHCLFLYKIHNFIFSFIDGCYY